MKETALFSLSLIEGKHEVGVSLALLKTCRGEGGETLQIMKTFKWKRQLSPYLSGQASGGGGGGSISDKSITR